MNLILFSFLNASNYIDGDCSNDQHWKDGEPSHDNSEHDCVLLSYGDYLSRSGFMDVDCADTSTFLCNSPNWNLTNYQYDAPTFSPTLNPTNPPTTDPTTYPTMDPNSDPSTNPTVDPTIDTTSDPTVDPT